MEKAHAISNWDRGTDVAIEITKNYIKSEISENKSEACVKILKERRGVKCGSVVDSFRKVLAGGIVCWCKF